MIPFAKECTVALTQAQVDTLLRMVNSRIRRAAKYIEKWSDQPDANPNHMRASMSKRSELQSLAKRLSNAAGRGNCPDTPPIAQLDQMPCIECGLLPNDCRCTPLGHR